MTAKVNPKPADVKPRLYKSGRVARMLDVADSTVWRWAAQGRIPKPVTVAGIKRWRAKDIDKMLRDAGA